MPADYEAMRDKFVDKGMSMDKAQTKAAKIHNAKHPNDPVGRHENPMHETATPSDKHEDMLAEIKKAN